MGIGTQELLAFARKRGVDLPDLDPKLPMLAVAVCVMGWSWAPFIAHYVLLAILRLSLGSNFWSAHMVFRYFSP